MGYAVLLVFFLPLQIIAVNGTAKQLLFQQGKNG